MKRFVQSPLFHIVFSPSGQEREVVDTQSRETIGSVMMMNPEPGNLIQLSGRAWRIINVKNRQIFVKHQASGQASPPGYMSSSGHASRELAREMAKNVWGEWEEGLSAFYYDEDEEDWVYAHFLGFNCAILLTSYLEKKGLKAKDPTPFSFRCSDRWHEEIRRPRIMALKNLVSDQPKIAAKAHSMGRLYKKIHDEYGSAQAKLVFDWKRITRDIQEVSFREVEQQEINWAYNTDEIIEEL